MSIDQATLARRLRQAREEAKLTQEAVADALKLPRTAVVQIESANRAVSSLELVHFSRLYHRSFSDFFAAEMPGAEQNPILVLHRIEGFNEHPEVEEKVQHCLEICREGKELETVLGQPDRSGPPSYAPAMPRSAGEAIWQGVGVAEQERQRLGLGDAPIQDMADLLNAQDIWASGVALPDQMSGMFLRHHSIGFAILVNYNHAPTRKRFSYAHEYAHALFDQDLQGGISTKDNASELREKRANAFAAAFLMPRAGVEKFVHGLHKGQPSRLEQSVFDVATEGRIEAQLRPAPGSQDLGYQDVALMADWFKVSYDAATYQLRSFNIISQRACEELLGQKNAAREFLKMLEMFDDEKPTKKDRELVAQVARLAIEAYRREEISRGRILELAKVLGINGRKMLESAEATRTE